MGLALREEEGAAPDAPDPDELGRFRFFWKNASGMAADMLPSCSRTKLELATFNSWCTLKERTYKDCEESSFDQILISVCELEKFVR